MNWHNVVWIFQREVRDQLRDRRTLFTIVVLPLLLYPLLGICSFQIAQFRHEEPARVHLIGAAALPESPKWIEHGQLVNDWLAPGDDPKMVWAIDEVASGGARENRELAEEQLRYKQFDAVIVFAPDFAARLRAVTEMADDLDGETRDGETRDGETRDGADHDHHALMPVVAELPRPEIYFDGANPRSVAAQQRLERALARWRDELVREGLRRRRLPDATSRPFAIANVDLSPESSRRAVFWSKLLPFVVLIWSLTGAFYPAIDLCAGEKERGTLETLLVSPATRHEIVWGKLLTVIAFSIGTSVLNLACMGITGTLFFGQLAHQGPFAGLGIGPPPALAMVWLLLALVPISALFSALSLAIAAFARSSKEGQYYLMPLFLLTLPLMLLAMLPTTRLDWGTSLVPVTGVMLLLERLVEGELQSVVQFVPSVLGMTVVCCWLSIRWAVEQFNRESVLFRESERFHLGLWLRQLLRDRAPTPTLMEGILCGTIVLVIRFGAGMHATVPDSWAGFAWMTGVGLVGMIGLPAILMAVCLTRSPARTLLLARPTFGTTVRVALLAVAFHPVAMLLSEAIGKLYPMPDDLVRGLEGMHLLLAGAPSFWQVALVLALLPAVCEELMFRGVILSGLRSGAPNWAAIALSSFFFGAAHGMLQQSLSAFVIGLLIGLVAVRTGSLVPCILFHAIHNSLSLATGLVVPELARDQVWVSVLFDVSDAAVRYHPLVTAAGAVASIGLVMRWIVPETESALGADLRPRPVPPNIVAPTVVAPTEPA